jgi:PKD repeat protein
MQPFPKVTVLDPARAAGTAPGKAQGLSGKRAVDGLGANLEAVARWYGLRGAALREKLLEDPLLRVAGDGRLYYIETPRSQETAAKSGSKPRDINDGQFAPLDQTFKLNSKPGSNKTLYLNFRGQRLVGTQWNGRNGWNRAVINAPPFNFEGSEDTFSDEELRRIQQVWQIVAEDYAPFDVNVTTEAVSEDRMIRSNPADQVYGGTVLITRSRGVFDANFGGIASFNSFGERNINTSLAFGDNLGFWKSKSVAEAASHEAGHMFGLFHDGQRVGSNTWAYYIGHGIGTSNTWMSDPNSWAPIMGVGYYTNIVQFSRGEYPGANNQQDDFAVIQQYLKLRDDEAGNTPQTAARLPVTLSNGVSSGTVKGVLSSASDRDLFAFTSGPGELTARVTPAALSPNSDLVLSVLSDTGAVLASANPPTALNAAITFQIPRQGTYYLQVNGTGYSGRLPGYSAYGSVGNYTLTARYGAATATPPVASLTATQVSGTAPLAVRLDATGSKDDGEVKFVYWDFGDGTTDDSGSLRTTTRTYRNPGSYRASIRVVDDQGLSATASQTITVNAPGPGPGGSALTAQVTLNLINMSANAAAASGTLFVRDQAGRNLSNATVRYSWSGLIQGPRIVTSNTRGTPILSLASSQKGCFVLTVTGITLAGYTYNAAAPAKAQVCR